MVERELDLIQMTIKINKYMETLDEKKRSIERTKPAVIELDVTPQIGKGSFAETG